MEKNPTANARDAGSIPGSERSPGEGNGNPLQYSCLGNAMVRYLGGILKLKCSIFFYFHETQFINDNLKKLAIF